MADPVTIVTRRDVIRSVPNRWKQQYKNREGWGHVLAGSGKKTYDRIRALDLDTVDRAAVDEIIGNDTWTENKCDMCEADADTIVALEGRWEKTFSLCLDCFAKARSVVPASPSVVSGRSND